MSDLITVSHTLSVSGVGSYQNKDIQAGNFLPFGFSGAVFNRNGDNVEATLTLPRNDLSNSWARDLVEYCRVVTVSEVVNGATVFTYNGQATSSTIDETVVGIKLSSVLDAVGLDVPWRYLTGDLIGPLPTMSGVRTA